jgi:hypothetical protein
VAQLLPQHAILLAQVVDCELLCCWFIHPTTAISRKPERVENSRHLEPALFQASQPFALFGRYGIARGNAGVCRKLKESPYKNPYNLQF